MKKAAICLAVLFSLTGCIIGTKPGSALPASGSFSCSSRSDCDASWSRAIAWVVANSAYKIQIQSDNLIQTYGPDNGSLFDGFLINRVMNTDGTGTISFSASCGNQFGCNQDPSDLLTSFGSAIDGD